MGKGRDKKKKAAEKAGKIVHGKGGAKTENKTDKNKKKKKKREMFRDGTGGDDVESLLAQVIATNAEAASEAKVEPCEPPPPRVNFTAVTVGQENRLEMVLFGGERNDGRQVAFFRELYRYSLWNNRWVQVSPAGLEPGPRSGHAATVWKNQMFVFGGEFSNPNATQFHHYRDLWHLRLEDNEWAKIDAKGRGPTARSGHRMAVHGDRIFLFGGFSDFVKESKYYNDLFVFDIENVMWNEVTMGIGALRPPARSGFRWVVDGDSLLLFGGYYKEMKHKKLYDSSKSAGGKAMDDPDEPSEVGTAYNDVWRLDTGTYRWDQVRFKGSPPTPRCGFNVVMWKRTLVLFGGVYDEEDDDQLKSTFYDDLYGLNVDKMTFYPMTVKSVENAAAAKAAAQAEAAANQEPEPEPEPEIDAAQKASGEEDVALREAQAQADAEMAALNSWVSGISGVWRAVGDMGDGKEIVEYFLLCAGLDGGVGNHRLALRGCARPADEAFSLRGNASPSSPEPLSSPPSTASDNSNPADSSKEMTAVNHFQLSFEQTYDEDLSAPATLWSATVQPEPPQSSSSANDAVDLGAENTMADVSDNAVTYRIVDGKWSGGVDGTFHATRVRQLSSKEEKKLRKQLPTVILPGETSKHESKTSLDAKRAQAEIAPLPRISHGMVVFDNRLFVYGGLVEKGRAEHTLNDLWSLDLRKLDKWECIEGLADECLTWYGSESEEDDEEEEGNDDDDEDSGSEDGNGDGNGNGAALESTTGVAGASAGRGGRLSRREQMAAAAESTPQLGESLREFFQRTADYWANVAAERKKTRMRTHTEQMAALADQQDLKADEEAARWADLIDNSVEQAMGLADQAEAEAAPEAEAEAAPEAEAEAAPEPEPEPEPEPKPQPGTLTIESFAAACDAPVDSDVCDEDIEVIELHEAKDSTDQTADEEDEGVYGFGGEVVSEAERKEAERKRWREAAKARRLAREQGKVVASAAEEARAAAMLAAQAEHGEQGEGATDAKNETVAITSAKEARRDGFAIARERYFECLPELREFEQLAAAAAEDAKEAAKATGTESSKKRKSKKDKKRR